MRLKKDCENSKREKKKSLKMDQNKDCPLCLEVLEMDDVNFYPCKCGYQICRFCWHRIRTNENELCPACRRLYSENPATFKPLSAEELQKLKNQKKMKDLQRKQKIAENRKQLGNVRVVQRNLVFVVGLPLGLGSDDEKLQKISQPFKQIGHIQKFIVNDRTNYAGSQGPSSCAYITYHKVEDALKSVRAMVNTKVEGRQIKVSLGTTKYCSNFLKNIHCPKPDCMYLHEIADEEASFTKEEIHLGKHSEYEQKLCDQLMYNSSHHKAHSSSESLDSNEGRQKVDLSYMKNTEEIQHREYFSDNSSASLDSPVQSNVLHSECDRNLSLQVSGENEEKLCSPLQKISSSSLGFARNSSSNHPVKQSLLPESTVLNGIHSDSINFQNFPQSSHVLCTEDQLHQKELDINRQSSFLHSHSFQNNSPNGIKLPERGSTILNMLSNLHNGESSTLSNNSEPSHGSLDDDLGFDPCQESLKGLEDLLISEAKERARIELNAINGSPFSEFKRRPVLPVQSPDVMHFRNSFNQPQRQRDPPPGFSLNSFHPTQPFPSPVYDSGNSISSRISPVMDLHNHLSAARSNLQLPRFQQPGLSLNNTQQPGIALNNTHTQGISLNNSQQHGIPLNNTQHQGISVNNTNSFITDFSQQPGRTFSPREVFDLMSHSSQSQRFQNFSQPQFSGTEQHTSPPFWNNNSNQSHWRPSENSFYNQSPTESREASPFNNLRLQPQRNNDLSVRQMQQLSAKFNNFAPFSDFPHLMFPNKLQNPAAKKDPCVSLGL